jgi:hypothetical protein
LANILASADGSRVLAVDVEENRERIPVWPAVSSAAATAEGGGGGDGQGGERGGAEREREHEGGATGGGDGGGGMGPLPAPPLTLVDCIFVKGKQPGRQDQARFLALLPAAIPALREFIRRVKAEDPHAADAFASRIGYSGAPSAQQVAERLATLERCVDDAEHRRCHPLPAPLKKPRSRKRTPGTSPAAPLPARDAAVA